MRKTKKAIAQRLGCARQTFFDDVRSPDSLTDEQRFVVIWRIQNRKASLLREFLGSSLAEWVVRIPSVGRVMLIYDRGHRKAYTEKEMEARWPGKLKDCREIHARRLQLQKQLSVENEPA